MKTSTRCLCLCVLAMGAQMRARAQQLPLQSAGGLGSQGHLGYLDLLLGLGYTDNAFLSSAVRKGDGVATAGFATDYARNGMLSINLLGNIERVEYLQHSFAGSFYGQFAGSALWGKQTDPVQWQLSDSFGEALIDPLAAPTPQALQTINDVSTGPNLNLHFGLATRFTLAGRYSRTTYQRSPFDSQTYTGSAELSHALTGASSVAVEGSWARTEYVQRTLLQTYYGQQAPNFDIRQASLVYQARYVRTQVLLRAGYNMLDFGAGNRHGAPLYEVSLSRKISPFSTVFLNAEQHYSTNGTSLGSTGAQISLQTGAALNPAYAVAQPYNERSGSLGWTFNRARTNFSITGMVNETMFNESGLGNTGNYMDEGVSLALGRQLRPTLSVQLQAQGTIDRYTQLHARTRRETFGLTVSKRFFRLAVSFYVDRMQQNGAPGRSGYTVGTYHDDRVGLYFTYTLFGAGGAGASAGAVPGMGSFMGGY